MTTVPLSMRKTNLTRLLARRVDGIFLSDFEQSEIGPACSVTPAAGRLVSKHRDRPYRQGRSPHWVKVKKPAATAFSRVRPSI
jgi:bifunctional non-homologous end joining protein LigD